MKKASDTLLRKLGFTEENGELFRDFRQRNDTVEFAFYLDNLLVA